MRLAKSGVPEAQHYVDVVLGYPYEGETIMYMDTQNAHYVCIFSSAKIVMIIRLTLMMMIPIMIYTIFYAYIYIHMKLYAYI